MERAVDPVTRARDKALGAALVGLGVLLVLAGPTAAMWLHSGHAELISPDAALRGWGRVLRDGLWSDPASGFPRVVRRHAPGAAGWWAALLWLTAVYAAALFAAGRAVDARVARPSLGRRWWHLSGARPRSWARPRDLEPLHVDRWDGRRLALGTIGWQRQKLAAADEDHVLLVAPTGAGKTSRFIVRWALRQRGPIVSLSTKDDVYEATHRWRRRLGRVWVWDPFGRRRCARWSPLLGCEEWSGALRRARWLASVGESEGSSSEAAQFWREEGAKLLAPLLHAAALAGLGMGDVLRWLDERSEEEPLSILEGAAAEAETAMERLAAALHMHGRDLQRWLDATTPQARAAVLDATSGDPESASAAVATGNVAGDVETALRGRYGSAAAAQLVAVIGLDPRNAGTTYMSAANLLHAYRHPAVLAADGTDDLSPDRFLDGENTLYIVAGSEDQEMLAPIVVALLSELITTAERRAREGTGPERLWVLGDEMMNIAPIRQLPRYLATVRSAGIRLVTVVQDLAQLRSRFGADGANTILSNSRCKVFMGPVTDQETRRYIVDALGDEVVGARSRTIGDKDSTTLSDRTRPRATAQTLQQLGQDRTLVVSGSLPAAIVRTGPWWDEDELRERYAVSSRGTPRQSWIERSSAAVEQSDRTAVSSVAGGAMLPARR